MSHALTEADTFTATVVVPDGTDPGSGRTDDVELLAQSLANRTNNLNLHAARKDVSNTFTADQTVTAKLTIDDLEVIDEAAIPQITSNVQIDQDLNVLGSIDSGADIFASDDVIAGNEFQYGTPATITKAINPMDCLRAGTGFSYIGNGEYMYLAPGEGAAYTVRLPAGATPHIVRIKAQAAGADADIETRIIHRGAADFGGSAVPSFTTVDTNTETVPVASTPSYNLDTLDWQAGGALTIDKDHTYQIYILHKNTSTATALYVIALDHSFTDPGPRNH